jgi:hypothetical protein
LFQRGQRSRGRPLPFYCSRVGTGAEPERYQHTALRHYPLGYRFGKVASMLLLESVLITFVVVILVLYLVNMLPIDGRAKQIIRIVVIIIGVLSLLRPLMY